MHNLDSVLSRTNSMFHIIQEVGAKLEVFD